MRRAHSRQTTRNDLPALCDELCEQTNVLVVDALDLLDTELADLLAPEILASAFARTARPARPRTTRSGTLSMSFCRCRRLCRRSCCSRLFSHDAPSILRGGASAHAR